LRKSAKQKKYKLPQKRLKISNIACIFFEGDSGLELFKQNPAVSFTIRAPLYWWIDTDWIKYYLNMPSENLEFCVDAFGMAQRSELAKAYQNVNYLAPRQLMQIMPLSTLATATIELTYREIIEVCENYVEGEWKYIRGYGFPNEREWKDFCETLLDIKGVRDLVKEKV